MTKSVAITPSDEGIRFNFGRISSGFTCTVQRAVICLATRKGSDPLFPEAGTKLPDIPGTKLLYGNGSLQTAFAGAKKDVIDHLRKYPTVYPSEGLASMTVRPVPNRMDRTGAVITFKAPNHTDSLSVRL